MFRFLKYCLQIIPLARNVINWYHISLLFIGLKYQPILKLRNGTRFQISHHLDALTIKEVYLDQSYALPLHRPRTIVDIGANIGTFSVWAAQTYPRAQILAFEPSPATFRLLTTNLQLNHISNVLPRRVAVAERSGSVSFYTHPATGLSSLFPGRPGAVRSRVACLTLPQIFRRHRLTRVDFLKMDCEGAEYSILFACPSRVLGRISHLALEYHDGLTPYRHSQIVERLVKSGFHVQIVPHPIESNIGLILATSYAAKS